MRKEEKAAVDEGTNSRRRVVKTPVVVHCWHLCSFDRQLMVFKLPLPAANVPVLPLYTTMISLSLFQVKIERQDKVLKIRDEFSPLSSCN